jgi:hydrophobe/amphiphile efflux-3 (HAE3) family protein
MKTKRSEHGSKLEGFTGSLGSLVANHPGKLTVIFLLMTVVMVVPIQTMDTSTSMSDFAPESEFLKADEVLRSEFKATRPMMAILEAKDGSVTDRDGLLVLKAMEEAVISSEILAPYLVRDSPPVISLVTPAEHILAAQSNGSWDIGTAPEPVLSGTIDAIMRDEELSFLVSKDSKRYTLFIVNFRLESLEREDESVEIALEEVLSEQVPEGFDLHTYLAFNEKMREDTIEGLGWIMPMALILVIAVLWFSLRNIGDVLISIVGVVSILIITFGIFSLVGLKFSQLTFFGPILILVLAIDFAIHILFRYNENRREGDAPRRAMSSGLRMIGVAVLVSTITTAVAFMSNGLSTIPAVAGYGMFLGIGITVSFLVMMLFVPSMKVLGTDLWRRTAKPSTGRRVSRFKLSFPKSVATYPSAVILVAVILFAGSLFVAGTIPKNMSARDALSEDSEVIQSIDIIENEFPVTGSARAFIIVSGDVTDPDVLAAIDGSLANMADDRWVAQVNGTPSVRSVMPVVHTMTALMDNGTGLLDGNGDGIPDDRDGVKAVLERLWNQGLPGHLDPGQVHTILSKDDSGDSFDGVLLSVETRSTDVLETGKLIDELDDDLKSLEARKDVKVLYAGPEFEGYQMATGMTDGMLWSTLATVVICTIIVMLLMGSVRTGFLTAVPIILITGWIMGAMYLMGYTLNMVTATITAMTVGVGIDYSIHMMQRYREERSKGRDPATAMDHTMSSTGISLTAAAVTTFFGFAVIATSDITMFRTFGILSALMISFALVSALLVLPAIIILVDRRTVALEVEETAQSGIGTDGERSDSVKDDGVPLGSG